MVDPTRVTAASPGSAAPAKPQPIRGDASFQAFLPPTTPDLGRAADSVGRVLFDGGWGSGVLLDQTGLFATAQHVVGKLAPSAPVQIEIGGRVREARFLGNAQGMDLAFLRLSDTSGLKPARWGSAEAGDAFTAIGFPGTGFGQGRMRVDGQITAFGQSVSYGTDWASWQGRDLGTTSAPLLPGQSGGAVVNAAGELIGIAQATMMDTTTASVFAPSYFVPADQVAAAYRRLVARNPATAAPAPRVQVAEAPIASDADPAPPVQQAALKAPEPRRVAEPSRPVAEAAAIDKPAARPAKPEVPVWLKKEMADSSKPMSAEAILEWNRLRKLKVI